MALTDPGDLLALLRRVDALQDGGTSLTLEELQALEARDEPEGAYVVPLVAGAVAGHPERITLTATPRSVELDIQGGASLPVELLQHPSHELLQTPLRRRLRHLVVGISAALRLGAAEIEVACGELRLFLTPRGSSTAPGKRPAAGFTLRLSWPGRNRCSEPHYVFDRFALSPVPIKVNGSLVNPALDVGECAVALELLGDRPVLVDSEPLLRTSATCQDVSGWLLLGGDWSGSERPRSRVYFVVDGLGYPVDDLELGCPDLRAVIHAPGLPTTVDCERLLPEHPEVTRLQNRLARHIERAKQTLARDFPGTEGRTLGSAAQELLRLVVNETRARGQARQALHLARKISEREPHYLEVAASLATRLAQYPVARELATRALTARRQQGEKVAESLTLGAFVQLECGEPVRAENTLRQASGHSPESLDLLSSTLLAQGRYAEADRCAAEAAAGAAEGPFYPQALLGRARACLAQDRLVEAGRLSGQAADLFARDPLLLAQARVHQALTHYLAGELEEADDRVADAAARYRVRWGAEHPELGAALFLRGLVLYRQRQTGKAGIILTQSLEQLNSLLGEEHPDVAAIHLALAAVRQTQADLEKAADHARRAREIYSHRWGVAHPAVARTLDRSARISRARGLLRGAEEDAREAVRIRSFALRQVEALNTFPDTLGTVSYRWWTPGDEGPGWPGLRIPPARLGREVSDLVRSLVHLAQLLRAAGKTTEAQTCLSRAREFRACRGSAALALAPEGQMRRNQQGFTVLLRLQAPGRLLTNLYLDTGPRAIGLSAEQKVRVDEGVMVLKEPERRLLQADSPLLRKPWTEQPVSLLLHAADPAADGIRGKPRVITASFQEGPCLRVPVRL